MKYVREHKENKSNNEIKYKTKKLIKWKEEKKCKF